MAKSNNSFGDILGAAAIFGLAALGAAAQAAAESNVNQTVARPEKVEEAARNIVAAFKYREEHDKFQLKYSRFELLNLEGPEFVEDMEDVLKNAIYQIATYDVRNFLSTRESYYQIELAGVNYDADSSAIANSLDWENVKHHQLEKVYLVWLGLKMAKESYARQARLDLF